MLEPLLTKLNNMRVILATTSKQRQDLLRNTMLKFEIYSSDFEENLIKENYTFSEYVMETALNKATNVYQKLNGDGDDFKSNLIIIGLDTMVAYDGKMYGKPKDENDAEHILKTLTSSGLPHYIYTGVAIKYNDKIVKFTESTTVYMAKLTDEEIKSYVKTGEPLGKAGAYAIQGIGGTFVKRIDGDYNNVVGIPLCKLTKKLKELLLVIS